MLFLPRFARRLDPRRSLAARLLFAFFLAFAVPGAAFVFLLERRLGALGEASAERFAASQLAQETMRLLRDAERRAQGIERRARVVEEAAWSLGASAQEALTAPEEAGGGAALPAPDAHGHVWNPDPASPSLEYISLARSRDPRARRDLARSRALEPLMAALRERRPEVRSVSLWTASGAVRASPWSDLHEGILRSGGELESFVFNRLARFPARRPPDGDRAVWMPSQVRPSIGAAQRALALFVPVRDAQGALLAGVSLSIDARRFVADAMERGGLEGDLWFVLDARGHGIVMPTPAARLLQWRGEPSETLGDNPDPERRRLATAATTQPRSTGTYRFGAASQRFATVRDETTGLVFVEGLSASRLAQIGREADPLLQSRIARLRRDAVALFVGLVAAVFGTILLVSRRISAPILDLAGAAEEVGRGRAVEVGAGDSRDEVGRLAAAIHRLSRRVERRVETLHRLHSLFRTAQPRADLAEVLSAASQAIAGFTRAERVWFFLHDPDRNRLEAAWPGWNLPEELARELTISVESPSIVSLVFRTGEIYVSNDLEHDPNGNRWLPALEWASNAILAPLKTEEKTIGVAVAVNRDGGFGPEEADALTMFADAASLLIQNARLYTALSGTVTELRRASRLKDQFLQNVNHELRTPLTSIVGWTDLFGEEDVDRQTLKKGLRQIRHSARLLLALIDDLLDLARLDRGMLRLDWKPVALGEIIARSLDTVRLMADARGVAMIQAPLPDPMPVIRADPLRLQQILWNLLVNAIKFTNRHGRVIVRVEREPERLLVGVEDDGIGIPESDLPHIFDRFRQVDGSATRFHPGMGIGLSLAQSLVELHGGTIWAESVFGRGSRFTFSLPIRLAGRRASGARAAGSAESERSSESDPVNPKRPEAPIP